MKFPKSPNGRSPLGESAIRAHRDNPGAQYLTTKRVFGDRVITAESKNGFERVTIRDSQPKKEEVRAPLWLCYGFKKDDWPYERDYVLLGSPNHRTPFKSKYAAPYKNTFPEGARPETGGYPNGTYEVEYGTGLFTLGNGRAAILSKQLAGEGGGVFFSPSLDRTNLNISAPPGGYALRAILLNAQDSSAIGRYSLFSFTTALLSTTLAGAPGPQGGFVPARTFAYVLSAKNPVGSPLNSNRRYALYLSKNEGRSWTFATFDPPVGDAGNPLFYGRLASAHRISPTEILVAFVGVPPTQAGTLNVLMMGGIGPGIPQVAHGFFHLWDLTTLTRSDFSAGELLLVPPADMDAPLSVSPHQRLEDAFSSIGTATCPDTGDVLMLTRADSYDMPAVLGGWSAAQIRNAGCKVAVFRKVGESAPVREATLSAPAPVVKLFGMNVGSEIVFKVLYLEHPSFSASPPNAAFFVCDSNGEEWRLVEIPHPAPYVGQLWAEEDALYFTVFDPETSSIQVMFTRRTADKPLGAEFVRGGVVLEEAPAPPMIFGSGVRIGSHYYRYLDPGDSDGPNDLTGFYAVQMENFGTLLRLRDSSGLPVSATPGAPWASDARRQKPWEMIE